jgi:hypothetical protein
MLLPILIQLADRESLRGRHIREPGPKLRRLLGWGVTLPAKSLSATPTPMGIGSINWTPSSEDQQPLHFQSYNEQDLNLT